MAQIQEIIKKELNRPSVEQMRKIHLYTNGKFLRAYEWSAWLCCQFAGELQVNSQKYKEVDHPVLYVGFPTTSLEKFTPKDGKIEPEADGSITITLPPTAIADDANPQTLTAEYDQWKKELPPPEENKKAKAYTPARQTEAASGQPASMNFLLQRILTYPVELRTPIDNMQFIAEIKQMAAMLLN